MTYLSKYKHTTTTVMGSKNQRISITDGKEAEVSLKKFCFPNKISPEKRKLPSNDTEEDKDGFYGTNSKTSGAAPCRKLTLLKRDLLTSSKGCLGRMLRKNNRVQEKHAF